MISTLERTTKKTVARKPVSKAQPKKVTPVEKNITLTVEELDRLIVDKVKEVLLTTPFYHDPNTARLIEINGSHWPPHPVYSGIEGAIVVEAVNENGDFDFTRVQEYLEDLADSEKVRSGEMTQEELMLKWGMAEEASPIIPA